MTWLKICNALNCIKPEPVEQIIPTPPPAPQYKSIIRARPHHRYTSTVVDIREALQADPPTPRPLELVP